MNTLLELATQLQESAFGLWLREAPIAFPVVEGLHLLSLALSFGLLLLADLRLLGWLWRDQPLAAVLRPLRPWLFAGFSRSFITGRL